MNGDEPAFMPWSETPGGSFTSGITKREYYAAKAMQGIITGTISEFDGSRADFSIVAQMTAEQSFILADAMIAAGSKKEGEMS